VSRSGEILAGIAHLHGIGALDAAPSLAVVLVLQPAWPAPVTGYGL
jgi:hypothetical protein